MRFLTDQDLYASTVRLLIDLGHDVATANHLGLAQAEDSRLLRTVRDAARILVTRDRDFGALVFVEGNATGVIYLRVLPSTLDAAHGEFERVLTLYNELELLKSFVVIEPGRHRIRKLSSDP